MSVAALRLALPLLLLAAPVAAAEQVAALRLQAEVAAEAACMMPPDGEQPAAVARLDASPPAKAAFCRCFAAAVAREAPPDDQQDLIDSAGIPPEDTAERAVERCLGRGR